MFGSSSGMDRKNDEEKKGEKKSESDRLQNKSHTKVNQFHSFHVFTFIIPQEKREREIPNIEKTCSDWGCFGENDK